MQSIRTANRRAEPPTAPANEIRSSRRTSTGQPLIVKVGGGGWEPTHLAREQSVERMLSGRRSGHVLHLLCSRIIPRPNPKARCMLLYTTQRTGQVEWREAWWWWQGHLTWQRGADGCHGEFFSVDLAGWMSAGAWCTLARVFGCFCPVGPNAPLGSLRQGAPK